MNNHEKFMIEYDKQLRIAVKQFPDTYCYSEELIPVVVVGRMSEAFKKKSYNKDGVAIKRTCKVFNIPYTYNGINEFLKG